MKPGRCFCLVAATTVLAGAGSRARTQDPVPEPGPAKSPAPQGGLNPAGGERPPSKGAFEVGTDGTGPQGKGNGEVLFGRLGRGLNFTGGWTLSAQDNQVSGSSLARDLFNFQNNNNFLNTGKVGPFRQNLNLGMNGKLFNTFDVDANLTNNRVNASLAQLMRLRYDSKRGTKVDLGDVSASLSGNDLVPFSRNVQGIRFERDAGKGARIATLASVTRALTRRNTLLGQGTSGPYYLGGGQIVPGSERIYLNGMELSPGKDYRLDYPLGTLYFLEGRIVNRSDTVEYTYESLSFNSSPGMLTGTRVDLPLRAGSAMGVTILKQAPSGARRGDGTVTEYFPVSADLTSRYTLVSPIKPGTPVVVRYQERILTEGVALDYLVNRELNYIQLRRPLPPDTSVTGIASLRITYTPVQQLGIQAGRDIVGVDTVAPIAQDARVKVQMAQSRDAGQGTTAGGLNVQAVVNSPKSSKKRIWSVTSQLSALDDSFVGIDSTAGALQRNGRTVSTRATWAQGDGLSVTGNLGTSLFPNLAFGNTVGSQPTGTVSRTRSDDMGLTVTSKPRMKIAGSQPTLTFNRQQRDQRSNPIPGATGNAAVPGKSAYRSQSLGLTWGRKGLDFGVTVDNTLSRGRSAFLAGYSGTVGTGLAGSGGGFLGGIRDGTSNTALTDTSTSNLRFNTNWTPVERLSVSGNIGVSRIRGASSASTANNTGLGVQWWAIPDKLSADLNFEDTGNGQSVSGYYSGGGFLGGGGGGLGASTGQRTRVSEARFHFTPYQTLDVQFGRRSELSLIPNYDNTQSTFDNASISFDATQSVNLTGTLTRQIGTQVGGQGNFDNFNYSFGVTAGAPQGLTTRLNFLRMNFGSNSFLGGGGFGGGGVGGGIGGGFGSSLAQAGTNDIWSLRFDYPVRSVVPFLELQSLDASDPLASQGTAPSTGAGSFRQATNYRRSEARFGVQWNLTSLLGASLNMNLVHLADRDDPRYSYRAKTFNFDINARF